MRDYAKKIQSSRSTKSRAAYKLKKTGKLFSFSCLSPVILTNNKNQIKKFSLIGEKIGLLFQIADDLIDYRSSS